MRTFFFKKVYVLACILLALSVHSIVFAVAPARSIGFQGQLYDGASPLTGTVNATFTFYDALSGGSVTGSPISKTVTVNKGYFGTQFTESELGGIDFDQQLYIEVNINGTTLSPRTSVNSSVSSLKAFGAFSYASAPAVGPAGSLYFNTGDNTLYVSNGSAWTSAASQWGTNGSAISYTGGNVGIGTASPVTQLEVAGSSTSTIPTTALNSPTVGTLSVTNTDDAATYTGIHLKTRSTSAAAGLIGLAYGTTGWDGSIFFRIRKSPSVSGEVMRLLADGSVAIGTTTPSARLHVVSGSTGTTTFAVQATTSQTAAVFDVWSSTGSSLLNVQPGGMVGIGTSTPNSTSQLHLYTATSAARMTIENGEIGTTASADIRFRSGEGEFGGIGDASTGRTHMSFWTTGAWPLDFFTNSQNKSNAIPRMRIDSTGNVGINSADPDYLLTLVQTSVASSTTFAIRSARTTIVSGNYLGGMSFVSNDSNLGTLGSTTASIAAVANTTHTASALGTDLVFSTANGTVLGESMRILGNGNVGIGTSSTVSKLAVTGTSGSTGDILTIASSTNLSLFSVSPTGKVILNRSGTSSPVLAATDAQVGMHVFGVPATQNTFAMYSTGNANNVIIGYGHSGTADVPAVTTSGSQLLRLSGGGYTGSSFIGKAEISMAASETWSATSTGAYIGFQTTANGQTTRTEKVRIDGNGFVGIGTTTPTASLHASGTIRFSSFGAGTLSTDSNGNVTVSSDERLKDIKGLFATGLDKIKALSPILYTWKTETGYDTVNTYAGFSAQNVQSAIPEAVSTDANGFLTLSDRPILAALVNAVKDIASRLEAMATRVQTQELCLDDVCVNKDQLRVILLNAGQSPDTRAVYVPVIPTTETPSTSTPTTTSEVDMATTTVETPIEPTVAVPEDPAAQ